MMNTQAPSSWLINFKPRAQAKVRLFCFPYAGGASHIFRLWPDSLPPTIEVCPVHLPGRGKRLREAPFTHYQPFVQSIAEGLSPYLDKPFVLFGHSLGAMLSFELARQLRRMNLPQPEHLFVTGRRAPQIVNSEPPTHNLPEAQFIAALRKLNGTPTEALENPELMQLMLPLLRADFEVCDTYNYVSEEPLAIPVTAYGGLFDTGISREQIESWREQTTAAFSLRMLPGDHFFINTSQTTLLRLLLEDLTPLLSKVS
jgi:medium-chain acyl-[acyl-carrier-protein] hydrolase